LLRLSRVWGRRARMLSCHRAHARVPPCPRKGTEFPWSFRHSIFWSQWTLFCPSKRTPGAQKELVVKLSFPNRRLPERPDLEQLRRQAKELLDGYRAGDERAVAEVKRFYRGADPATFALHDAQLVLARNYGYGSWPKLKAYVDGV